MEGMERKLAVLFADVSGRARLYERLNEAEAERAVDRCIKRMERAIEGFGGRLVKASGGEIMVLFETADAACQSAQDMQQRVSDLPPVSGVQLAIRIGFHVGPVMASGNEFTGETIDATAHIVGQAQSGQILCSGNAADELPGYLQEGLEAPWQPATGDVPVFQVPWQKTEDATLITAKPIAAKPAVAAGSSQATAKTASFAKLCLRYRGRSYVLDDKTPVLSLGRDEASDIVIEDRKASRHHGRVEKRGNRFFYVDRSTNGSYVVLAGEPEAMVRRTEIPLLGKGSVCFGSSGNDPTADCATFEFL